MSEKQYKKKRKQTSETPEKKSKNKKLTMFNVISVVIIAAFLALAAYAVVREINPGGETNQTDVSDTSDETDSTADTSTLGGYAEAMSMTYDEMAEKYGLDPEKFSADMKTEDAFLSFTLENMAKMSDKDVEEFKTELDLPADVQTDVANGDLSAEVMMKVNGVPYTVEELREYGLSEDITGETVWRDAQEAVYSAASEKMGAESAQEGDE